MTTIFLGNITDNRQSEGGKMKRYFVNLKLSRKILFSPVLVLSMLIIFGAVAYIGLMSQKSTVDKIFNNAFTNYKKASTIKDQVTTVHQNIYKVLAWSGSSEQRDRAQDLGRAQLAILGNVIKNIETNLENKALSVNDKKIYAILLNNLQEYNRPIESVVDAVTANGAAAAAFMNEGEAKYQTLNEDLARMMDQEDTAASMQYASSITGFRRILGLCAIVLLLAVISSVLATIFTARVILDPIKKTVSMIETIARGDLTQRIDIDSRDEIGSMAREFNNFIDILRDIISRVADNSHRVSDAATMLDTAAEQMATGVEQAACQVNSVAAASEEMSMTSSEIAENCVRVARSSEEANGSVRTGETVIMETVMAMNSINERVRGSAQIIQSLGSRSEQIGQVVGLINDIADQTNLLALNAAIEAARAGEHGRGFAVVADEVRKLAERTSHATKDISETIAAMQNETKSAVLSMREGLDETQRGAAEAEKSGDVLHDILSQVNVVTTEINQIAVASEQQTATTNEIANNIQQISEVMAETARRIQDNANAASQLAELSRDLRTVVGQFTL